MSTYGAVQDGEYDVEEDELGSEDEEYYDDGDEEAEGINESREEDESGVARGSSGFFYADPVSDSPDAHRAGPSTGPRLKQIRAARRSFGLGHFNFTPTPERQRYEDTPGTASLATSPTSHIYLDPARDHAESTPLLSADRAHGTPQKLIIEETAVPDSVASRRQSAIGDRRRVSGISGRRLSVGRRSIKSRRSIVIERGESTDGQTVSTRLSGDLSC